MECRGRAQETLEPTGEGGYIGGRGKSISGS